MRLSLKRRTCFIGSTIVFLFVFSCVDETGYQKNAQAFYEKYRKRPEVDLLFHYDIKPRGNALYLQACQRSPSDTAKIWAIYQSENLNEPEAKIELAKLKIAITPFPEPNAGKRIFPEYEPVRDADTTGARRDVILHVCEVIRAFHRLGLREVICGGRDIIYLVEKDFMMVYAPDTSRVPESVKNIATKLDANWYYQISFEHREAQERRLDVMLRDLWKSAESKSDSSN
ncbi:hypothetical protein L0337_30820 [candidate division KSB1 bacterium]|nr:hypothetical protein [candidate division KSB1 bacterium]